MAVLESLLGWVTDTSVIAVFLLFLALILYLKRSSANARYPPGPPSYPLIGSLLSMMGAENPSDRMVELSTKYGDIMYMKVLGASMVLLSGYDTIHKALVRHAGQFSDRPDYSAAMPDVIKFQKGIIWNSGESWRNTRKFAIRGMRELGVGKEGVMEKIEEEAAAFITLLTQQEGQPVDFKLLALKATNNIISNICFGKRFEYNDPKMAQLLYYLSELFKPQSALANIASLIPGATLLPPVRKAQRETLERVKPLVDFVDSCINERESHFDRQIIRDFVDLYFSSEQEDNHSLSDVSLRLMMSDLFTAGSETTATSLSWHVVYMLHYPDVMKRCQQEIDKEVGRSRTVTMADKAKLVYVEATILEVMRMSNTALLTLPRFMKTDVDFCGYTIPANSIVLANLKSVHMQPDLWAEPERFHPPRFIDNNAIEKKTPLVVFGLGPRTCVGEILAKQEVFLFFANLLQRFDLKPASDDLPPLKGVLGLAYTTLPFQVKLMPR